MLKNKIVFAVAKKCLKLPNRKPSEACIGEFSVPPLIGFDCVQL